MPLTTGDYQITGLSHIHCLANRLTTVWYAEEGGTFDAATCLRG